MGILTKFVSSKFSGYALIALIVAGAGAAYWFWSELKEFGSLEEKSQQQAVKIESQALQLAKLGEQLQKKQQVNTELSNKMAGIKRSFGADRQRIKNAEANADKDLLECMDMPVPNRMCVGEQCQYADGGG